MRYWSLAALVMIASGCSDAPTAPGGGSSSGGETTGVVPPETDTRESATSRGNTETETETDPDPDSTGSESTTTGAECEPPEPVDARGFVPTEVTIDGYVGGADALGDLDGDGLGDFVTQGMVVFGRKGSDDILMADIMKGVGGIWFGVGSGGLVANAGDFNGDGTTDLLLGQPTADYAGPNVGRVYIVFGKTDSTPWTFEELGTGQVDVVVDGVGGGLGVGLAGVGDLDGDGRDDVLFSAPNLGDGFSGAGRLYAVRGTADPGVWAEADVGGGLAGWQLDGTPGSNMRLATRLAPLGDLDDDGTPDYAVVANDPERIYVVFGGNSAPDLSAIEAGRGGYVVTVPFESLGAGDVDGDGRADLVVGNGDGANVVFGKSSSEPVTEADLIGGEYGYAIVGDGAFVLGEVVGFIGDYDGDGFGDIVVGDYAHDDLSGRVYVVLGGCGGADVALADVAAGIGGFVVDGAPGSRLGSVVAGIGDINGDGVDEVLTVDDERTRILLGSPLR